MIEDLEAHRRFLTRGNTNKITLGELLQSIDKAKQRMSRKNQHRLLFTQCQDALAQLGAVASMPKAECCSQCGKFALIQRDAGEHSTVEDARNAPAEAHPVGR